MHFLGMGTWRGSKAYFRGKFSTPTEGCINEKTSRPCHRSAYTSKTRPPRHITNGSSYGQAALQDKNDRIAYHRQQCDPVRGTLFSYSCCLRYDSNEFQLGLGQDKVNDII